MEEEPAVDSADERSSGHWEEEEDYCRICRCGSTPDDPLFYPCLCKGSIRYIHQNCLLEWLSHSNKTTCELCKHPFRFKPVYKENTPDVLPKHELITGALKRAAISLNRFIRIFFVCSAWFFCVPVGTSWIWRLYFGQSIEWSNLYSDCVWGSFLSASIFFFFMGFSSLLEFMEQHNYFENPNEVVNLAQENVQGENVNNQNPVDGAVGGAGQRAQNNGRGGWQHIIDEYINLFIPEDEMDFDELVGFKGPIIGLITKILLVLMFNGGVLAIVGLLPYHLGSLALLFLSYNLDAFDIKFEMEIANNQTLVEDAELVAMSDHFFSTIFGYGILTSCALSWLGLSFFTTHNFNQVQGPIAQFTKWIIKFIYTFVKVCVLLFVELGIFPQLCGWWLDYCTLALFDSTWESRIAYVKTNPFTSLFIHLVVGLVYMVHFASMVGWVRAIVRREVLWFLRSPEDNPVQELIQKSLLRHVRRILLSALFYGSIIYLLVGLPIKFINAVIPWFLPFNIWVRDPMYEGPIDLLLVHIAVPFIFEYVHPKLSLQKILKAWFHFVGDKLSLSSYLFPQYDDVTDQELPVVRPDNLATRISFLLFLGWISLFVINISMLVVPVMVGRWLFNWFSFPQTNDLYTMCLGLFSLWAVIRGLHATVKYISKISEIAARANFWITTVLKCTVLLSLWLGVIPFLIGIFFEFLVIFPLRVPVYQNPVMFPMYQDWALGLFYLKIWYRLIMLGPEGTWKRRFEQVKTDGINNLNMTRILKDIIFPVMGLLLKLLLLPYIFSKGLVPLLSDSIVVHSFFYRISWVGFVLLILQVAVFKAIRRWFVKLHNNIRDDKYLIGKNLQNIDEWKQEENNGKEKDNENEQEIDTQTEIQEE